MMKLVQRSLAVAGLLLFATSAHAFSLRNPQVVLNPTPLQTYFNVVDPGINVSTQQLNAQLWSVSVTGNTDFTLVIKGGPGGGNSEGVYNAGSPGPLFQVFPPNAIAGWYATLHFSSGNLVVSMFDQNSVFMGQSFYAGVNPNNFGFYTQGNCGTWFSEDFLNPNPQMLAYASPAVLGDYWLCWNACPYNGNPAALSSFSDIVLNVQSVRPTPTKSTTWGQIKGQYH